MLNTPPVLDANGNMVTAPMYLPSGEKTAAATIASKAAIVGGIVVNTDGTNDATCIVYDSADNSGPIVARIIVKGTDDTGGQVIPFRTNTGLYVTIAGTGAKYQIYYLV